MEKSLIGAPLADARAEVKFEETAAFARLAGDARPEYLDAAAAVRAGLPGAAAPPTFFADFLLQVLDPETLFELGLDWDEAQWLEQEFNYFRPPIAGEKLTFVGRIAALRDEPLGGRDGEAAVFEWTALSASREPVFIARITLAAPRRENAP